MLISVDTGTFFLFTSIGRIWNVFRVSVSVATIMFYVSILFWCVPVVSVDTGTFCVYQYWSILECFMYADRYLYIFIYRPILVDTGTFFDHLSHSITLNGGLTGLHSKY